MKTASQDKEIERCHEAAMPGIQGGARPWSRCRGRGRGRGRGR